MDLIPTKTRYELLIIFGEGEYLPPSKDRKSCIFEGLILTFSYKYHFSYLLMIRYFTIFMLLCSGILPLAAQQISLIESDVTSTTFQVSVTGIEMIPVRGNEVKVKFKQGKGYALLQKGAPDVLKLSTAITIPDDANMQVQIVSETHYDIPDVALIPSKGNLTRDIDPSSVDYVYGSAYQKNQFFPGTLATLQTPYILRDLRGQSIWIYPLQYNPVTHTLRVYKSMTIKVSQVGVGGENVLRRARPLTTIDQEFAQVYARQFLNFGTMTTLYTPVSESGEMLILCHDAFMQTIVPFVNWKKQKGIHTTLLAASLAGTTPASIQTFIANYYAAHPNLKYVIFVGDNPQIPCMTYNNNPSDNAYAYLTGSDSYPELFMGRFSAEDTTQLKTIIQRNLMYEKTPNFGNWYEKGMCVASDEGPGDDNQYDYEHEHEIRMQLLGYTYTNVAELFDGTHSQTGWIDAPGNPNVADFVSLVNSGVGVINYTGHGGTTSFVTTGMNNNDVFSLTNGNAFPFIWSVGCVTGEFMNATCFAEAWQRARTGNNPAGAIVSFMSTINQSWDPPMEGQDEMNKILTENAAANIKRTFGGLSFNGCYQMNDVYGTQGDEMTDTWTLFGDPSLMVYTRTPQIMNVTHAPDMPLGAFSFAINGSVNGAWVSLTQNNEILGMGEVNGGIATINFYQQIQSLAPVTVTVTAFNYAPYIATVNVTVPTAAFVIATPFVIQDANTNNNHAADYNEDLSLDETLQNLGIAQANGVTATLASADAFVNITDNTENYGDIVNGPKSIMDAFQVTIADNVPDQHTALFQMTMTDNVGTVWNTPLSMKINAPVLTIGGMQIEDASGNNNGFLDAGETVNLIIATGNNGHADAIYVTGALTTPSGDLTIQNANYLIGNVSVNGQGNAIFTVTAAANIPQGTFLSVTFTSTCSGYSLSRTFNIPISPAIINFEPNNTFPIIWQSSGNVPWFTSSNVPFEGANCKESGNIANDQFSSMSTSLSYTATDSISFYRKTSSEAGWDFLNFMMDGILIDKWSGEEPWKRVSYPVSAGTHTFEWKYEKDNLVSEGADAGYVDYIVVSGSGASAVLPPIVDRNIQVFPNPAQTALTIHFDTQPQENTLICVYDPTGKRISTLIPANTHDTFTHTWNVSDWASGMYYVQCIINGKATTHKVVIE